MLKHRPREQDIQADPSHTPLAGSTVKAPYSASQLQLLASKGVSYNPTTNTWDRITPQGRGQYAETVNPDAVFKILIL
jgi:hypothetical protein